MSTPTLSSRGPKRRKTSPSKSVPPHSNTTPRASFLSPTRASLSRFNPSLLPRQTSAGTDLVRRAPRNAPQTPDINSQFLATGQDALNFIMGEVGSAMQNVLSAARQQPQNPTIPAVLTGDETDEQMAAIRAANRARRQSERQQEQEQEEEKQRRASERRSTVPIEQARRESDDAFDAPEMESALPDLGDEDDLPDTPEQLRRQLELDDTPPRGLLFSSPSKRRKRRTNLREKVLNSPVRKGIEELRPPDSQKAGKQPERDQVPESEPIPETRSQEQRAPEKDPETIAKEIEKQRLQSELRMLQDEVQQYARHVERIEDETDDDMDGLVQLINFSKSGSSQSTKEPAPLSSLLTSFLPFSIPVHQQEIPLDHERPISSHFPIQRADPLPLLTLFTPLKFTSAISAPANASSPSDPINQTHYITLRGPASLLSCNLDLNVSSQPSEQGAPSVESLSLTNLSPWASQEIGPFLQTCATDGDINAIGYALGRYWDLSIKRAQCWSRCWKEFTNLVALSEELRNEDEEEEVSTLEIPVLSKRELLPHLGRQFLVFQTSSVVLRIEWKLECDWTGEVESVVSANAALPIVWHEADTTDALKKIETTFDVLVSERGVFDAVRIIVGLLFQDEKGRE